MREHANSPENKAEESAKDDFSQPSNRRQFLKTLAGAGLGMAFGQELEAAAGKKDKIERAKLQERIDQEVNFALEIIRSGSPSTILSSRFLVASLYYSEAFFNRLAKERPDHEPTKQILLKIKGLLTDEFKNYFIAQLEAKINEKLGNAGIGAVLPALDSFEVTKGKQHSDALDLFAKEGQPVKSMTRGIVILAEADWNKKDPLSTTSQKGGNAVIVYNPGKKEFYRYCHLAKVAVRAGDIIEPGKIIGEVGHTGTNASRPGHGSHLHLEINSAQGSRASAKDILSLLE